MEMTLLVFRKPGSKSTKLFSPDGNRYSALEKGNSNWRSDEGYDLINRKPEIITSVDSFLAELIDIYKKLKPKREEFQVVEESDQGYLLKEIEQLQSKNEALKAALKMTNATMSKLISGFGDLFGG
jgi:hypothetical protein